MACTEFFSDNQCYIIRWTVIVLLHLGNQLVFLPHTVYSNGKVKDFEVNLKNHTANFICSISFLINFRLLLSFPHLYRTYQISTHYSYLNWFHTLGCKNRQFKLLHFGKNLHTCCVALPADAVALATETFWHSSQQYCIQISLTN
jgi:hypothetical protein